MISLILLIISILLLTYSFYLSIKLRKTIEQEDLKKTWNILLLLNLLFIIGYIAYGYLAFCTEIFLNATTLIVSIIFFLGALFVMTIIFLSTKKIAQLQTQEQELRNINKTLEQRVKNRTKQLAQSNKIKELVISVLDHDLKNSLAAIIGFSSIVIPQIKQKKLQENIQKIKTNAEKMNKLITDVRTYSKIESFEKNKEKIDLQKLAKELIKEFEYKTKQKNIRITNKIIKQNTIQTNPIIREVFYNLIDNAIKYSPKKTIIQLGMLEEKKHKIFTITDQGKGIPDKYKELIFERFERAGAKQAIEGSGIGLAICKHIVELHKGTIWVEDNPLGGTIFKVKLPKK